jgi:endonuclease YncB( thermonuclease family)
MFSVPFYPHRSLVRAACTGAVMWFAISAPVIAQPRPVAEGCVPHNAFIGIVNSTNDGRTLVLSDGRQVRLAAIETPGVWARDILPALLAGRAVTFSPLSPQPNRYGRTTARAFLVEDDISRSLEVELVAKGLALTGLPVVGPGTLATHRGETGCTAALLAAEKAARTAKIGLWADPDYDTKSTDNPAAILTAKGRFAVIEGKVLSVRDSGGTVYLNFGRRWSEDFTVTILKRISAKFVAAGIDPKRLEGRRIRVRGFVEERGGPWIEATAPEQIEIADGR